MAERLPVMWAWEESADKRSNAVVTRASSRLPRTRRQNTIEKGEKKPGLGCGSGEGPNTQAYIKAWIFFLLSHDTRWP